MIWPTLAHWIEELPVRIWRKFDLHARWDNEAIRKQYLRKGIVIPPLAIIKLVDGSYDVEAFIRGGKISADWIERTLAEIHVSIGDLHCILDFGCGCGRVLQYLNTRKSTELHGCDYNPRLAEWCRRLVPSAKLAINDIAPPLPYESGKFDLIYAISTFTHWSVNLQKQWISELTRVLRPNGLLLFTTHGEYYRDRFLTTEQRESFDHGDPIVWRGASSGTNKCAAFHPVAFVKAHLLTGDLKLEVFLQGGTLENLAQDIYLVRKPNGFS
jgi:SAM-dependent methyltransferase